jgi:hypothetical protein
LGVCLLLWAASAGFAWADLAGDFEQANKLYEQGRHTEAAEAYQRILKSGEGSATVYYNLGNAWFKAGQYGRAIAAYREAEEQTPRDPNLQFNLQFVRKKSTGSDTPPDRGWRDWFRSLTVNEWTIAAAAGYWMFMGLLIAGEIRPTWRRSLRGITIAAGCAAVCAIGLLAIALRDRYSLTSGVVVVPNAVVRYGPLEESQVFYQLRDGSEVTVLDQQQGEREHSGWVQVQDSSRRVGWVKRDQVQLLHPRGFRRSHKT